MCSGVAFDRGTPGTSRIPRLSLDGRRLASTFEAIFVEGRPKRRLGGREVKQEQDFTAMSQAGAGGASKMNLRQHPRPLLTLCRCFYLAVEPDWLDRETVTIPVISHHAHGPLVGPKHEAGVFISPRPVASLLIF